MSLLSANLRKFATPSTCVGGERIDTPRQSGMLSSLFAVVLLLVIPIAGAQKRAVDSRDRGYRMILVDQLVTDPVTHRTKPAHVDGKLGFITLAVHPDKRHVLIELVGDSYESFAAIRAEIATNADPQMKAWEKALVKREDIQSQARFAGFDVDLANSKSYVRVP